MLNWREIGSWYWLATALALSAALAGFCDAVPLLFAIVLMQVVHYGWRTRSPLAFPLQVRIAYLAWLAAGLWPPLQWMWWIAFAGTWALVLFGYCPLARLLSLMPWNRREPFTPELVWRTITRRPVRGSFLQARPAR